MAWRFLTLPMTTTKGGGRRRPASSAFKYGAKGFSIWFADGSDLEYLRGHFELAGVARINVADLVTAGFTIERCPDPGGIEGAHANVYPPPNWTHGEEVDVCRIIAHRAELFILPPDAPEGDTTPMH